MCLAIPGQIVDVVDPVNRLARVDVAGVRRNVNIGLLDDGDGNEMAGIRVPEVAVPLGTAAGWNFRSAAGGNPGDIVALLGEHGFLPGVAGQADGPDVGRLELVDGARNVHDGGNPRAAWASSALLRSQAMRAATPGGGFPLFGAAFAPDLSPVPRAIARLAFPSLTTLMVDVVKDQGLDKKNGIDLEAVSFGAVSGAGARTSPCG